MSFFYENVFPFTIDFAFQSSDNLISSSDYSYKSQQVHIIFTLPYSFDNNSNLSLSASSSSSDHANSVKLTHETNQENQQQLSPIHQSLETRLTFYTALLNPEPQNNPLNITMPNSSQNTHTMITQSKACVFNPKLFSFFVNRDQKQ